MHEEKNWKGQTFPSTPNPVSIHPFLTVVRVSMPGLLLRVVRMRFWNKGEKSPDETLLHPRGIFEQILEGDGLQRGKNPFV